MQAHIRKRDTYETGIHMLFELRDELFRVLTSFKDDLSREDFSAIPFINAYGFQFAE